MKKNILIIIANIFLLIVFLAALEIYCYRLVFVAPRWEVPNYKKFMQLEKEFIVDHHLYTNYAYPTTLNQLTFENDGRSFVGENYKNKKPILLLGCSYTYGLGLSKDQTFGYQLSKYTKRPVYNWGWKTEGPDYSLMELKNKENILKLDKNPPEYIIYTFMYDHPQRLLSQNRQYRWYYLRKYNLINGQKFSVVDNSYLALVLRNKMFEKSMLSGNIEDNLFNYITRILIEMRKEVLKHYPNTKFVILLYMDSPDNVKLTGKTISPVDYDILYSPKWKKLQNEGFIVVSTEELLHRTMNKPEDLLKNDFTITAHPNEKIWKTLIPPLAKKLDL